MKSKEFVKNHYGISIVKCCASCIHNTGPAKNDKLRNCKVTQDTVSPSDVCYLWDMKRKVHHHTPGEVDLDSAGKGGGNIKKIHYLKYFLNYPKPMNHAQRPELEDIRREYEQKYGSIFIK